MTIAPPRVSIVIPFRNGERFLARAVASVRAQTYASWELLLVDDGSSDASARIAGDHAEGTDGRVRCVQHPGGVNRGTAATRNLGLQHARGDLVAFLDVDDEWLPLKLERQVALFDANDGVGMVFGQSEYWLDEAGRSADYVPDLGVVPDRVYSPPELALQLHPLASGGAPPPSDIMLRRSVAIGIGGFEESFVGHLQLYEDQAFLIKAYLNTSVYVAGEVWDRYRVHADSCMSVVHRNGHDVDARQHFLDWLAQYIRSRPDTDPRVIDALSRARDDANRPPMFTHWSLRVASGAVASLSFSRPPDATASITIETRGTVPHDVQVNVHRCAVVAATSTIVHFWARADGPRTIAVGVARARHPWDGLGLYALVELDREWTRFALPFVALATDTDARVHFDAGLVPGRFELSDVLASPASVPPRLAELPADPFTSLRSLVPADDDWGWNRGLPVDRYYIEQFLQRHAADIRGRVLEVGDDAYTVRFGGDHATSREVLDIDPSNPRATIIADLGLASTLSNDPIDCAILTQTLQYVYDLSAAVNTIHRALRPGGVALVTLPVITPLHMTGVAGRWYWNFTADSARRLFSESFGAAQVSVSVHGNLIAATAFLHGLAANELREEELAAVDPAYAVIATVRAVKTPEPPET